MQLIIMLFAPIYLTMQSEAYLNEVYIIFAQMSKKPCIGPQLDFKGIRQLFPVHPRNTPEFFYCQNWIPIKLLKKLLDSLVDSLFCTIIRLLEHFLFSK